MGAFFQALNTAALILIVYLLYKIYRKIMSKWLLSRGMIVYFYILLTRKVIIW